VVHYHKHDLIPLPASLSSLGRTCCTQFSKFRQFWVNQWIESPRLLGLPHKQRPPDWPPPSTPPISFDHSLQVHLQTHSIMFSKSISTLGWLRPPNASPKSLDHGHQLHPETGTIVALKGISIVARLVPPIVSATTLDPGLGVHLCIHSITVWWHAGAGRQTAHHQHCAPPGMATEWNWWERVVLAQLIGSNGSG